MLCDSLHNGACDGNTLQIKRGNVWGLCDPIWKQIPARFADVLTQMDGLPVLFVDAMPDQVIGQEDKCGMASKILRKYCSANLK